MLALFLSKNMNLTCANRTLNLSRPHVMGILNVTPDSFSDGGVLHSGSALNLDVALSRAEQMVEQGAFAQAMEKNRLVVIQHLDAGETPFAVEADQHADRFAGKAL